MSMNNAMRIQAFFSSFHCFTFLFFLPTSVFFFLRRLENYLPIKRLILYRYIIFAANSELWFKVIQSKNVHCKILQIPISFIHSNNQIQQHKHNFSKLICLSLVICWLIIALANIRGKMYKKTIQSFDFILMSADKKEGNFLYLYSKYNLKPIHLTYCVYILVRYFLTLLFD